MLLIGLTDDDRIGSGISTNLDNMKSLLEKGLPPENLGGVRVVKGPQVTADNILAEVRKLSITQSDTVFCYYAGHGGYDPKNATNDSSNGHFFAIPGGNLMRRDLVRELQNLNARLTVLVTDTCNAQAASGKSYESNFSFQSPNPILVSLLLGYKGIVDINGASKGEYGWYTNPTPGGWFTYSLVGVCLGSSFPNPRAVTWNQFFNRVSNNTSAYFQSQRPSIVNYTGNEAQALAAKAQMLTQQDQRPIAFILDVERSRECLPPLYTALPWSPDDDRPDYSGLPLPAIVVERNGIQSVPGERTVALPLIINSGSAADRPSSPVLVTARQANEIWPVASPRPIPAATLVVATQQLPTR